MISEKYNEIIPCFPIIIFTINSKNNEIAFDLLSELFQK
jgi:hypothetical protein